MLEVQWLLASCRCPLPLPAPVFAPKRANPRASFETPALAAIVKTPEKKHETLGAKSRALPAHLGDVARDLGRFFLELFPFCGCDRFVPRGDQEREFFFKHAAVFRAFHKFVVKLNGIIALHFVIAAIVLFTIPVCRRLGATGGKLR